MLVSFKTNDIEPLQTARVNYLKEVLQSNPKHVIPTSIAADYDLFGSPMPGRSYTSATGYRYGFNGHEKDDEIKGNGNSIDYGERMYDPRLGRWLSIDKEFQKGAAYSPYNFALNNPIIFNDPDGNWVEIKTTKYYKDKEGQLQVKQAKDIFKQTVKVQKDIIVHNAKIYNYDAPGVDMVSKAKSVQSQIEKAYNRTDFKPDGNKTDPVTGDAVHKIDYVTTLKFDKPIEIIDNLKNVVAGSDKPDNLFIIASDKTIDSWSNDGAGFTYLNTPIIFLKQDVKSAIHEFGHDLGLEHNKMSKVFNNKPADDIDMKNMNNGTKNESYDQNNHFQKMKKDEKKK